MYLFFLVILNLVFLPNSANAHTFSCNTAVNIFEVEPTFGPEFTFTNPEITQAGNSTMRVQTTENMTKFREIKSFLQEKFKPAQKTLWEKLSAFAKKTSAPLQPIVTEGYDKHGPTVTVIYPDKTSFTVSVDMAALEVQTSPSTLLEFAGRAEMIQREIFDMMADFGLTPHERVGGGHIHMGNSVFIKNPQLFRDFLADYANFPELTYGALGNHLGNSAPIASLKVDQQKAFEHVLQEFDQLPPHMKTVDWLKNEITRRVYTWFPLADSPGWGSPNYYQAIRFVKLSKTFELRAFRPQRNATDFMLQMELLQMRLVYLKANPGIKFKIREDYKTKVSPQIQVDRFYEYVTTMGGEWNRFKKLLPASLQNITPTHSKELGVRRTAS